MLPIIKIILLVSYHLYNIFYWNQKKPKVKKIIKNIKYGNKKVNKLDIIIPEKKGTHPVILYLHGGGFISSDKTFFTRICCEFASNGFVVFNINYGLVPKYKYPSQLQDVNDAINWISKNYNKYNCDFKNIFLAGDSSGAYIASLYMVSRNNGNILNKINNYTSLDNVKALILFYGAYNIETVLKGSFPLKDLIISKMFEEKFLTDFNEMKCISPVRNITNNFPPTFICASETDPLYNESVDLKNILDKNKVINKTLFFQKDKYPDLGHGFLNFYRKEPSKIAMNESILFIKGLIK